MKNIDNEQITKKNIVKMKHKIKQRINLLETNIEKGYIGKNWNKEVVFLKELYEGLRKMNYDIEVEDK